MKNISTTERERIRSANDWVMRGPERRKGYRGKDRRRHWNNFKIAPPKTIAIVEAHFKRMMEAA